MKSLRCLAAAVLTGAALLLATAAQARERYFAFEPDSDEARYRSGDLTITVHPGLMGSTVKRIYRERGADLGIKPAGKEFSERQALKAIGEGSFELQLY